MGPHERSTRTVQRVRAAVLSGVVVAVTVLAHVSAGGSAPSPTAVFVGWAVLALLLLPFTGRRLGLRLVLGLLAGGQLAAHRVLMGRSPSPDPAAHEPTVSDATARMFPGAYAGHGQQATLVGSSGTAHPHTDAAGVAAGVHDGGATMLLAHLLAAVAVGLWLVAGERIVLRLIHVMSVAAEGTVAGIVRCLVVLLHEVAPDVAAPLRGGRAGWLLPPGGERLALGSSSCRRGPPAWGS